jgi:hypothetical protein
MDLWCCPASREMENISRGPYLLRFCHYPHRGVDATRLQNYRVQEYRLPSPLSIILDSIYRDQQSNGLNPHKFSSGLYCTEYNLRLWIFIVFGGFEILFRIYLLSPLSLKNPKNPWKFKEKWHKNYPQSVTVITSIEENTNRKPLGIMFFYNVCYLIQ